MVKKEVRSLTMLDRFIYVFEKLSIIDNVRIFNEEWYLLGEAVCNYLKREEHDQGRD